MQIFHVPIATSSSGSTELRAAATGKITRVLGFLLTSAGAVDVKFVNDDGADEDDLTGLFYLGPNDKCGMGYSPEGWCETPIGEALNINLSAAVGVGGMVTLGII